MIPERMPEEIIETILGTPAALIGHLEAFKKSHLGWDDYARKIEAGLRDKLKKAFRELRRNGFICPVVDYSQGEGKIRWHQVVEQAHADNKTNRNNPPVRADLCFMCERSSCRRRDPQNPKDVEQAPCWHRNFRYMEKLRELGRI